MLDTEMLMPMPSYGASISGMHTRKSSNIVASVGGMVEGEGGGGWGVRERVKNSGMKI